MATLHWCKTCTLGPDPPNTIYSNGTFNVTTIGPEFPNASFEIVGLEFTGYVMTYFRRPLSGSCRPTLAKVSLQTPWTISIPPNVDWASFQHALEPSFASYFGPENCALEQVPILTESRFASQVTSTLMSASPSPLIQVNGTILSASPSPSIPPSQPTATATAVSPAQSHQSSSAGATETRARPRTIGAMDVTMARTRELIIGLVLAIVTSITLIVLGLAYYCIKRTRRRRKEHVTTAETGTGKGDGEGETGQLYLQPKAELDDEQRRHEMDAAEVRYEMDGADEIHELPGRKAEGGGGSQQLCGEEHSKGLDTSG